MPQTKRKSIARRSQERLDFEERLKLALSFVATPAESFRNQNAQLAVEAKNGQAAAVVKLAEKLVVDPRWLATGNRGDAAHHALGRFRLWAQTNHLPEQVERRLIACLELAAQPSIVPGVCRYCACTDEWGCPCGCSWVDKQATICSACLQRE